MMPLFAPLDPPLPTELPPLYPRVSQFLQNEVTKEKTDARSSEKEDIEQISMGTKGSRKYLKKLIDW
jgi:hypothetical protein